MPIRPSPSPSEPSNAIRFSVVETAVGRLLVAATRRGVCFLCFGAKTREVVDGLQAEFPYASLARDDAGLAPWARALAGPRAEFFDFV